MNVDWYWRVGVAGLRSKVTASALRPRAGSFSCSVHSFTQQTGLDCDLVMGSWHAHTSVSVGSGWDAVDMLEEANIEELSKMISLGDVFQLYSTKSTSPTRSLCRLWLCLRVGFFVCFWLVWGTLCNPIPRWLTCLKWSTSHSSVPFHLLAFLSCVLGSCRFRIQQFSGFAFYINVGRKQDILVCHFPILLREESHL